MEHLYITARQKRELDAEQAYRYVLRLKRLRKYRLKRPKNPTPSERFGHALDPVRALGAENNLRVQSEIRQDYRQFIRSALRGHDKEDQGFSPRYLDRLITRLSYAQNRSRGRGVLLIS